MCLEALSEKITDDLVLKAISTHSALNIDDFIRGAVLDNGKPIIDWQYKTNITGKLQIEIGDYLIDEVRDKYNIDLSFGEMDEIAGKSLGRVLRNPPEMEVLVKAPTDTTMEKVKEKNKKKSTF